MSRKVRGMFSSIADDYDRVNHLLSLGTDRRWRRTAVKEAAAQPGDRILDVATGTGDLAFEFAAFLGGHGSVVGVDFTSAMVRLARAKASARATDVGFVIGDALALPFEDDAFDVASVAFGIRNVDDPVAGLVEMARVVRPGGRVVVLEFGQPGGLMAAPYRFYGRHVMPRVGGWITGNREAYEYLPATAAEFPAGDAFVGLMRETGCFRRVRAHRLTGGIAWTYVGSVTAP